MNNIKNGLLFAKKAFLRDKVDLGMLIVAIALFVADLYGVDISLAIGLYMVYVSGVMIRFQLWKDKYADFYYKYNDPEGY
jgi:hypothetical protein